MCGWRFAKSPVTCNAQVCHDMEAVIGNNPFAMALPGGWGHS